MSRGAWIGIGREHVRLMLLPLPGVGRREMFVGKVPRPVGLGEWKTKDVVWS